MASQTHNVDTDGGRVAIHHTLGPGVNQAAPGNHIHDGGSSVVLDTLLENITLSGSRPTDSTAVDSIVAALVAFGATDNTTKVIPVPVVQKRTAFQNTSGNTDVNGIVTITHGLGWTPLYIIVNHRVGTTSPSYVVQPVSGSGTATTYQYRVLAANTGTPPTTGAAVGIYAFLSE